MSQTNFKIGDAVKFRMPNGSEATGKVIGPSLYKPGRGGGEFTSVVRAGDGIISVRSSTLKAAG